MTLPSMPKLELIPGAIYEILATVADKGHLTEGDRYGLLAACLDENLDEDERRAVNRLLHSILRGKVKIH